MVAYSFNERFVSKLLDGSKRQTLRAVGRPRHARLGDEVQLYTGMRTAQCKLIGRSICTSNPQTITIFRDKKGVITKIINGRAAYKDLNRFAMRDGFEDLADMQAFWQAQHKEGWANPWIGVLITWGDLL